MIAAVVPYLACTKLKSFFGYDDALDTFGVHAIGGTLGALLTGLLATASVNGNLTGPAATQSGLAGLVTHGGLWLAQLKAIGFTLLLSITATVVIAYALKAIMGLRPTEEVERQGLDLNEHGEEGYAS